MKVKVHELLRRQVRFQTTDWSLAATFIWGHTIGPPHSLVSVTICVIRSDSMFQCYFFSNRTLFAFEFILILLLSVIFLLSLRFSANHSITHRPQFMSPSMAPGCCWWKWWKRSWEVLLLVWSLVQQPSNGPTALRGQETSQERSQGTPAGAASRQSGCHREHRSVS